jgi:hypothetical protein
MPRDTQTDAIVREALKQSTEFEGLSDLLTLYTLPIGTAMAWTSAVMDMFMPTDRQIDCVDRTAQLPIPNPLQKAKDSDLFA